MRGIDQGAHVMFAQVGDQPRHTAEPAAAGGYSLLQRRLSATRQRQGDSPICTHRKLTGELPRFAGSAQNQNLFAHVVR